MKTLDLSGIPDIDIAGAYKGVDAGVQLAGVLYVDKEGHCISNQFSGTNNLPPITFEDIHLLTAGGRHVNFLKVTVDGDDIINADIVLGAKVQHNPNPNPQKDIVVEFTAHTNTGSDSLIYKQLAVKIMQRMIKP